MTVGAPDCWGVEAAGIAKRYRSGVQALGGVTLRLRRGRIGALIGANGSGKSTLLKVLAGLVAADAGTASVGGAPAGSALARARLGYLPETPQLPGWLTGREFLRYVGGLSGLGGEALERAIGVRARWTGLERTLDRPARTFSTGQRQRLGLAQALLHEPSVLLLDEPAAGLDPVGIAQLTALLGQLREEGRTVLFSSHFLPQVEATCDEVWLLHRGRVIWSGESEATGPLSDRFVDLVGPDGAAD